MADVASSAVSIVRSWTEGHTTGKDRRGALLSIVGAFTAGGNTNKILATALGFTKIESCSNILVYTTSTGVPARIIPAAASNDGTYIATIDVENATDANRSDVADSVAGSGGVTVASTETAQVEVHGY